jgi:hypothetical protein
MKKITILLLICLNQSHLQAQNIGINSTGEKPDKSAMLDIKSTTGGLLPPRMTYNQMLAIVGPAQGLMAYATTDAPGLYVFDGSLWRLVRASGGSDNFWYSPDGVNVVSIGIANVAVGSTSATNRLQVGSDGGFTGYDFVVGNGADAIGFAEGLGRSLLKTTDDIIIESKNGTGYVGVGENYPSNKLQIGTDGGYSDYDFAIGRNNQAMAIYQGPNFTNWSATDNISINPKAGTGYVGINVGGNPANKLQIGSVGSSGFATNDLAIGNGTNAFAIFQTDASTLLGSTTDIILKPRNNGAGMIGINTNSPRAPLEVSGSTFFNNYYYNYLNRHNEVVGDCEACNPQTSIYSQFGILASEFDAYSDARIKNIIGRSQSANDLQIMDSIQVTDYTYKDVIKYQNKRSKKVIAQQVEKFFPQIVSKHKDFIPNVYQFTNSITQIGNSYLLTFAHGHHLTDSAKKLRYMIADSLGMQQATILKIPNKNQVIIGTQDFISDSIFVYGEEVNDFRTVDYEGLTTLNISATQELSKMIKYQQTQINSQQVLLERLEKRITVLERKNKPIYLNRLSMNKKLTKKRFSSDNRIYTASISR